MSFLQFILTLSFVRWLTGGVFGVLVCLVQPETRGSCSFSASKTTKDSYDINIGTVTTWTQKRQLRRPHVHLFVTIDPQFFSSENDQKALHEAYLFARNSLQSSSQCGSLRYLECLPNFLLNYAKSRSVFVDFAAWFGTTYFHISGTCPMDRYEKGKVISKGVLGDDLKVRGVHNLYVADASVFPAIPSFPTAKLSMIVGLRAGDLMAEIPRAKGKMQL